MCEELELEILQLSRNGNHKELHEFMKQHPDVNINCQGLLLKVTTCLYMVSVV